VHIYLTKEAQKHRDSVMASAKQIDDHIRRLFSQEQFDTFQHVLALLQSVEPDYTETYRR
jgi:hypothetical protein